MRVVAGGPRLKLIEPRNSGNYAARYPNAQRGQLMDMSDGRRLECPRVCMRAHRGVRCAAPTEIQFHEGTREACTKRHLAPRPPLINAVLRCAITPPPCLNGKCGAIESMIPTKAG